MDCARLIDAVSGVSARNPAHAKFCLQCGTRLVVRCSNCRAELPPSAKFCLECGERVTPSGAAMVSSSASPEAYTPKHLAERILTAKVALEGERKQVTVLFADLKSSMELLADRDPEEARKILDPVLAHMMDAVHRYEGTVNQVMGDGVMALFGADRARRPRRPRVLCRAPDAGIGQSVRQGGMARARRDGADPRRAQLRRSRGPRDRQ
jgi:class 3 adenylate cyclase